MEAAGGAVVLPQSELTGTALLAAVGRLVADGAMLRAMDEGARRLAVPDAADRIARVIFEAARS